MIKSMTGYGSSEGQLDGVTYLVEIKAVNNRYLKTMVKLPEGSAFLEEHIERQLNDNLRRGMVNYVLRSKGVSANTLMEVDEQGLRIYTEKLSRVAESVGTECNVDLGSLLALPGVLNPASPSPEQAERIRQKVAELTDAALDELKQMRAAEGKALAEDLEYYCGQINEALEHIEQRKDKAKLEYKERLQKRVNDLLAAAEVELDETTLAREVAVFAEKSDISEEISRLKSHLEQFSQSCHSQAEVLGRRLDFIAQEMLREANTISSKASDARIAHWVVEIKCQIDRIKEQVQNVE